MVQATEISASSEARLIDALLSRSHCIFWDFDGVIKDSLGVKSDAFERLFLPYGKEISERVRQHHEVHGGVSRYEKMPTYLKWAGEPATTDQVKHFCDRFAQLVQQAVIDSPWVPGVREYLLTHHPHQHFVLVSATPQAELEQIVDTLGIAHCFREIHGAPLSKAAAIQAVLQRQQCPPGLALMVGDSGTDLEAARMNSLPFLLRRTAFNRALQDQYSGPMFDDLNHE